MENLGLEPTDLVLKVTQTSPRHYTLDLDLVPSTRGVKTIPDDALYNLYIYSVTLGETIAFGMEAELLRKLPMSNAYLRDTGLDIVIDRIPLRHLLDSVSSEVLSSMISHRSSNRNSCSS